MQSRTTTDAAFACALILLAAVLGGCSKPQPLKLAEPIQSELDKAVAEMACMPAEAFPYVSDEHPNLGCNDCNKLVAAGLLTKQGGTTPDPNDFEAMRRWEPNVRFELTEIGQSAYVPSTNGNSYYGNSHFCFGKSHVMKITRLFGPVEFGGRRNLGIRFIAQLDNPNPYIWDARAKLLDIKLPSAAMTGKPALYAETDVTAVINPNNPKDVYLDGSLHIGPIGEK